MRLAVVGAVTLYLLRLPARASALASDERDTLDQVEQLRDVVAVRTRQARRERDAAVLDQQVVLASRLGAIYRAFAGLLAAVARPDAGAIDHGSLPRQSPLGLQLREDVLPQPAPDARACHSSSRRRQVWPEGKSLVAGRCFHGTPVFKTKTMPVITRRASAGFLPAC